MQGQPMDKAEAYDLLYAFVADLATGLADPATGEYTGYMATENEAKSIVARIKGQEYDPGDGYDSEGEAPAE